MGFPKKKKPLLLLYANLKTKNLENKLFLIYNT
jgi:hypothetical protein